MGKAKRKKIIETIDENEDDEDDSDSESDDDEDDGDSDENEVELAEINKKVFPWNTYACSCYENCANCCCVTMCFPLMLGEIMHYTFSLSWPIAFLVGITLLPLSPCLICLARFRIRRSHRLQGNVCIDTACSLSCCCCCSACQVRDEIFFLREEKDWRLAYITEEQDRSPMLKPIIDMYQSAKLIYEERKMKTNAQLQTADEEDDSDEDDFEEKVISESDSEDEKQDSEYDEDDEPEIELPVLKKKKKKKKKKNK